MKALTIVFWIAVGGVGVSLAGTIVTAIKKHHPAAIEAPVAIPTPAIVPAH